MVVADDFLDVGQLGDDRVKAGGADGAAADAEQDLCVLAGKIAGRNAGNRARACGAYEVCAHVGDRLAGFLVVERYHQDRPRQADLLVGSVGTVPLLAANVESAAQVCGHCDKAAVGTGDRHVGKFAFLREHDVHTVVIVVVAAHQIIALGEQRKNFLGIVYALFRIQYACRYGIRLGHIQKLCFVTHFHDSFQ